MSKSKKNNKMYIRSSEWKSDYGGKKDESTFQLIHYLPLNCCCISLQPFTTPGICYFYFFFFSSLLFNLIFHKVCSREGHIFDLENILKWFQENGNSNPISGLPLKKEDLINLNFKKNTDGLTYLFFRIFL
jgi:peptidyl-prolyl cis-trans isomerase-like protein 2